MLIEEVSFREWVICKVRRRNAASVTVHESFTRQRVRTIAFVTRRAGDRRGDLEAESFARKEQRRRPERRIPQVEETSFDEFDRWKKGQEIALTGGKQ